MHFEPDYRHMLAVMRNERPARLPIYEHHISPVIMEQVLGTSMVDLLTGDDHDLDEYYRRFCRFFKEMTYDTVSCEIGLADLLPDHGAIMGGRPGPIQTRADFERYPWAEIPDIYWRHADRHFAALTRHLPDGMKALGGVGYGVFEISEDLVGFERLAYMQADDPELFADLYVKIGDLLLTVWARVLARYGDTFAICRMGDDLGFKTSTLVAPRTIRQHILPQYRRIIGQIKVAGKPFLWHSCGCIFSIMDDVIALGINAKHSNEDAIAPYERWIELYGERIGLLGGIDVDLLCRKPPAEVFEIVLERGLEYRRSAKGYALGSGNSIPDYVPVEGYLAMVRAAQAIRTYP
ncbi:MAG: uroporphyrinogen decarboxylase family protein [Caldilinea sp.]